MKGVSRGYEFDGASNGVPYMIPISFTDIEFANSNNPDLFASGLLMFEEVDRDEVFNALGFSDWRDRVWTEESIENAILYPTKAKMNRILAVRDILTIERIRGKMTYLINTSTRRPIDTVIFLVNSRWQEILRGIKATKLEVRLPEEVEDKEKVELKALNEQMQEQMRIMQEQIAALMAAQSGSGNSSAPAEKKSTRKKTE